MSDSGYNGANVNREFLSIAEAVAKAYKEGFLAGVAQSRFEGDSSSVLGVNASLPVVVSDSVVGQEVDSGFRSQLVVDCSVSASKAEVRRVKRQRHRKRKSEKKRAARAASLGTESTLSMTEFERNKFELEKLKIVQQLKYEQERTEAYVASLASGNRRADERADAVRVRIGKFNSEISGTLKNLDVMRKTASDMSLTPSQSASNGSIGRGSFADAVKGALVAGVDVKDLTKEFYDVLGTEKPKARVAPVKTKKQHEDERQERHKAHMLEMRAMADTFDRAEFLREFRSLESCKGKEAYNRTVDLLINKYPMFAREVPSKR